MSTKAMSNELHTVHTVKVADGTIMPQQVRKERPIGELLAFARQAFPGRRIEAVATGFTIAGSGASGFPVSFEECDSGFVAYIGPGVVEIESLEGARKLLVTVCSRAGRLELTSRGRAMHSWKLVDADSGRLLAGGGNWSALNFWHRRSTVWLQNAAD